MSGLQKCSHGWEYPTVDELVDVAERLDQVADKFGRLVQAYLVGGEEIHAHITLLAHGERHGVCISFVAFRYSMLRGRSLEDWLPSSVYEGERGAVYEQIQAPVLIPIAQDFKREQGVLDWVGSWYSVERLQRLERCLLFQPGYRGASV
jgi:hypothetical protein